ncbi:MAG TPA: hypothetical protein VKM54_15945 [Myxococcota bacterium]|nr:hypothetical protein [Myxococcota bacterium]
MTRLAGVLWVALVALVAGAGAAAAEPTVDLTGTWHVLIHYRDDTAHDPQQMRWDDRLWVFQRDAKGLGWTEYAIVVFEDETGRFKGLGGSGARRVEGAWEPNPVQLAQIKSGLEYNTRGTKSKTLRGSDAGGWSSGARGGSPAAANVITYSENWSIEGLPTKPVFTRDDVLGSASAEPMEGRTQYVTESIEEGGDLLRGKFERDGTRHGTFTMRRSGAVKVTEGSGKSQSQRMTEAFFQNYGGADFFSPAELQAMKDGAAAGAAPKDGGKELRQKVREEIERKTREQGVEPSLVEPQIDKLTEKISSMLLEGKSPEEIQRALSASSPRP